ncbi:hypothetical protein OG689_12280 [Kitasatospora sp. NBC_00240]|uniref:hypothetical protein n=1 Tax=Kitasatospora sp. NBC_00240 TaxID=2903567 RepID=UPI00224EDD8D|nr:hypothetical protein [Kitasatospora sp. NBC_00240]MCX5210061.1 hypothetical protein [Kitasatospora sp. NBC_00240]
MKASQVVLTLGGLAVVGAALAIWLPYHRSATEAEQHRVDVHRNLLENGRSFAAKLPPAFGTGPQSKESLELLGRGLITYLTATTQTPSVTVYFENAAPVGGPLAFAPDQEQVCFRDELRKGPSGITGDLHEIPCAEMPQVVLRPGAVLTVGAS